MKLVWTRISASLAIMDVHEGHRSKSVGAQVQKNKRGDFKAIVWCPHGYDCPTRAKCSAFHPDMAQARAWCDVQVVAMESEHRLGAHGDGR